jgi:hypothetical protein
MVGVVATRRHIALFGLVIVLAGCGSTASNKTTAVSTVTPTVTPSPSPSSTSGTPVLIGGARIVVHSSTEQVAANQTATVTAQCAPGETLFGGGEGAGYFEAVAVSDNYPSAPNAWTASASSLPSSLILTVDAYCLQAPATAITIVNATGEVVNCPAGDFVLGGGYRNSVESSLPDATRTGWRIQGGQSSEVFALCTHNSLHMEPSVQSTFTVPASIGNSSSGYAHCPTGQFATGGGFSGGLIADQGAAPDFTGYGIEVTTFSSARSETVVSLCAHA